MQTNLTWKETITQTAWLIAILLLTSIATGCHEGVGENCNTAALPNTMAMQYERILAGDYRQRCERRADEYYLACFDRADPEEDCGALDNLNQSICLYYWSMRINMISIRTCGTSVYVIQGYPEDATYIREVNMEDYDGDGIPNYWESQIGTNPCFAESFGCDANPDGTGDFDADGVPDSEDEWPICNMDDPAEMQTDCV